MPVTRDKTSARGGCRAGLAAATVVAVLAVGAGSAAGAASYPTAARTGTQPGPAGSVSGDQAEAALLASQIQADGQRLGQLAEQADAAQLHSQQLAAQLVAVRQAIAQVNQQLAVTRSELRVEAVAAYVGNDIPVYAQRPGRAGQDPSLTTGYADVASHEERQVINRFDTLLAEQAASARQLKQAKLAVDASVVQLRADQQAAQDAARTEQQALNGVNSQLRSLVAAAQAAQAQAMAAQVKANLARQRQLPPPSSVVHPALAAQVAAARVGPPPTQTQSVPVRTSSAPAASHGAAPAATVPPARAQTAAAPTPTAAPPVTAAPAPVQTAAAPASSPPPPPAPSPPPPRVASGPAAGASVAIAYAYAQLGKPYQWGGAGPFSFDCSGLVMMAWGAAGVWFPHLAQDQYDMTQRIPLSQLAPGDLVFFGTLDNVSHVGIYVGGGEMIDAPSTGNVVRVESIYWSDLLGAGRV